MGHCTKTGDTISSDHEVTHCKDRIAQKIWTCGRCKLYSLDPAPDEKTKMVKVYSVNKERLRRCIEELKAHCDELLIKIEESD